MERRARDIRNGEETAARGDEAPLRAELFSSEQLAQHALGLAGQRIMTGGPVRHGLLARLDGNERKLRAFNRSSVEGNSGPGRIAPAAEWLLDNFYLIEEQIQMARRHLPKGYSRGLPCLAEGASAGLPRVYDLVLELILHVDAQIDSASLNAFVDAFQSGCTLTVGELWAIPIMLRLGLIENLQRITGRLARAREDANLAEFWVERLRTMAEESPSRLVIVVAEMANTEVPLTSSFVAAFCQLLSRQSPVLHLARTWLEQRLGENALSIEHLSHQEGQNQAADQVSVSNSITSLRFIGSMDWKRFVDGQSRIESALRRDPAGVYAAMDFATRDRYRHVVESLARHSGATEPEVAGRAVDLATESARRNGSCDRAGHVGYYLIDAGLPVLERAIHVRWPWRRLVERMIHRAPSTFYMGGITALTLLGVSGLSWHIQSLGAPGPVFIAFALLFLLGASQLAVGLINWLSGLLVKPHALPRMDFSSGIAPDCRTMTAVPTMLKSSEGIDRLIETLEIHFLANRDPHLHFALLTDFADAPAEVMPGDDDLLAQAQAGIELLNQRHAPESGGRFFLFHRPRLWNDGEGVWMGFERKRGKLADFNAVLRSGSRHHFSAIVGDLAILPSIRYVITLDTDTHMPRDAAWKMVGAMAHPLNRPVLDGVRGIVTAGYGILQPRLSVSLAGARRSWFVRLYTGEVGLDPYTRQVSDVYQDLFGEGSFIGKGIYDVDAFRLATRGRFPQNTVLSHDLLEGCHVRSGLLSDVELYEGHPARYNVDVDRRHRWVRGDWQILQWLMPRVAAADGRRMQNPLSALSRWKILDNLRRSLVPPALVLLLLGSWFALPEAGLTVALAVVAILALPAVLRSGADFLRKPTDLPWAIHLRGAAGAGSRQAGLVFLSVVILPYEAWVNLDAIGRTLARLLVTRKRLLQWQTSGDSEGRARSTLCGFYHIMWIAPAVALAGGAILVATPSFQPLWSRLLVGLWTAAPAVAWWLSRPIQPATPKLTREQQFFLRRSARRHWHYFETFVTAEQNWLPPDNVQEQPATRVASRTSPTNLGLALLANLAARDFGYLSAGGLIQRTRDALGTMCRMERHQGHFYNWYDTRTLQPLPPLYVSSVDSGNLAGHLLTLGAGLREQADERIHTARVFAGLFDTATILASMAGDNVLATKLIRELENPPAQLRAAAELLERAAADAARIAAAATDQGEGLTDWARTLQYNCEEHLDELRHLAPWLALPIPDTGEVAGLDEPPTLRELAGFADTLAPPADAAVLTAAGRAAARLSELEELACRCEELAEMDFTFLFDVSRKLFITGFNVGECRADPGHYDLLASEARQCSYVAIAMDQVPQDHWFSMGRLLVASHGRPVLVSWSGSMFEYLMPLLVMPNFENTLLDHTCHAAVRKQIEYGRLRGVPWGISESAYNRTDAHLNYQYRAFGVPGLGLKRGLVDDLVIAPYATVLALMVAPAEACRNLQRLAREGREGSHGFYEAVDYTPSRLPPDESSVTIRSFMVHHQGMSLLALDSLLQSGPMQRRFMACPRLKATELLLQERVPRTAVGILSGKQKLDESRANPGAGDSAMRVFTDPNSRVPEIHLLSNGRYHVAISSAGAGYSRWRDLALTRWREDATCDCRGLFVFLQDGETGECWSTAYQPTRHATERYEAVFSQARAEFRVHRGDIEAHTRISVSPEDDVELRRITVTNHSPRERVIVLTSYAEVVLAPQAQDEAHPAFSNLFVQTEFVRESSAVLATRRARSAGERPPWLLHLILDAGTLPGEISCETDRARFIGRGGSLASPAAMRSTAALSNTVGSVLDPVAALRRRVILPAHGKAVVDVVLGAGETREAALAIVGKYQSARMAERAFDLAWVHSQVVLHQLDASEADVQLYSRMAGALVYADPARRAIPAVLANNQQGKSGLWAYGISGDAPLVVVRVSDTAGMQLVGQLIRAHAYWRLKGLTVDLVFLNENTSVYHEVLHNQITDLIASGTEAQLLDRAGGIFVRRLEHIPNEDRALLQAAARIVLDDHNGTLAEQLQPHRLAERAVPAFMVKATDKQPGTQMTASGGGNEPRDLLFRNGLGGFTRDGHEYIITLQAGQSSPLPWVNVLANPYFGTLVSESGAAYTWVENAREFRLTPWHNDPVEDPPGEALYIRDEDSGRYWSPTPSPARGSTPHVIRHGFGYTVFEHTEDGIVSELWVYVAMDAPVKYAVLRCRNASGRPRRLSVTGYCEWVLGDFRRNSLLHVRTEVDPQTGALLARNHYNAEFSERIAFIDVDDASATLTGDRAEFIGRNGNLARPAALARARLSGKVGAGLDPCGAVQVAFDLPPGREKEIRLRLGVGRSRAEVHALIRRFRATGAARGALERVWEYWNRTLGAINVDTPDSSVNVMANGWLLYQTLSCRMWGRTGFYQSGGAYGFRDQLQDAMALIHAEPALVREHLLRAASRQFREGDVQHWWHPPAGRGVRTHFSDDFLWLPYVTCHYVACVGDTGVLDENVPFLESRALRPEEESLYESPNRSEETASLYRHCVRAIEHGLRFGPHGLPLIGGGDWNDGMNRVGHEGRGESVWLGFFLYDVLHRFANLADSRNDPGFAQRCRSQAAQIQENIEAHAWDGDWYLRAFFDNGVPLGSRTSPECQIDSLPQSWAVLSGAGDTHRSHQAMESVSRRLVRRDARIVQLFDPPFDTSDLDPGYIKGYIPGVRENGGQYTHGAIWAAMAFARMGETERAWEIFALLNPVHHAGSPHGMEVYKAEPYVVAADVYGVEPHTGRGGWSWYTGSAAWMYRLLTETLLGVHREGDRLRLVPCPPKSWGGYKIHYRYYATVYHINLRRVAEELPVAPLNLDGRNLPGNSFPLHNDDREHTVEWGFH
ncbi:MAG: GH36-type glycosyl hydrolase domain-containing protein [Oceanipulchritudo sp.]